jgi:hypothetical protein
MGIGPSCGTFGDQSTKIFVDIYDIFVEVALAFRALERQRVYLHY